MGKILVIDDSSSVRNDISDYLKSQNLDVIIAIDGIDALNQISTNKEIVLALVDINMPNLDGLSMIQRVRTEMPNNSITFVILTTELSDKSKDLGQKLGVRGWIVKPFKGEQAIGPIKKLLAEKR